jgi:hypothetical protein
MSNVFNLKRFGNYFAYDCRRAWNLFGLILILAALAPAVVFIIQQLFSLILDGHMSGIAEGVHLGFMVFGAATIAMLAPSTIYGSLTEKRSGSSWLMIPASSFEKWLSMALVLLIVLMAAFFLVFLAGDGLMSLLFPGTYGTSTASEISSFYSKYLNAINSGEIPVTINFPGLIFTGMAEWVLVFAIGALYFKRSKVAKTILVLIGLSIITGIITPFIMVNGGADFIKDLVQRMDFIYEPRKVITIFNVLMSLRTIIVLGGLLTWLFFRIKTLKH